MIALDHWQAFRLSSALLLPAEGLVLLLEGGIELSLHCFRQEPIRRLLQDLEIDLAVNLLCLRLGSWHLPGEVAKCEQSILRVNVA